MRFDEVRKSGKTGTIRRKFKALMAIRRRKPSLPSKILWNHSLTLCDMCNYFMPRRDNLTVFAILLHTERSFGTVVPWQPRRTHYRVEKP